MTLSVSRWRRTAPVVRDVEAGLQLIHGLTQAGMIGTSKRRNTSARWLPFVVHERRIVVTRGGKTDELNV